MHKSTVKVTPAEKQLRQAFDRGIVRGREDALRDVLFEFHNESALLFAKLRAAEYKLVELTGR